MLFVTTYVLSGYVCLIKDYTVWDMKTGQARSDQGLKSWDHEFKSSYVCLIKDDRVWDMKTGQARSDQRFQSYVMYESLRITEFGT